MPTIPLVLVNIDIPQRKANVFVYKCVFCIKYKCVSMFSNDFKCENILRTLEWHCVVVNYQYMC